MIAIATGTRADWGLLRPLAVELRKRGEEVGVIATNMHCDPRFGDSRREIVGDGFEPVADIRCWEGRTETVAGNTLGFGKVLRRLAPRCLVILGDRMEMLGAASAALMEGVPIVHIAGGTISEGAIDDSIRHAISKMASLHLTETEESAGRLLQMGEEPGRVVVCGAPGVWNALNRDLMGREELRSGLKADFDPSFELGEEYLVVTHHPATRSATAFADELRELLAALGSWLEQKEGRQLIMTWPNNDENPAEAIALLNSFAERYPGRVLVVPSLGARRYLSAVAGSAGVVGNSSSGIVETPSTGVPTLNIGSRQRGRQRGPGVIDAEPDRKSIGAGLERIMSAEMRRIAAGKENPYFREGTPRIMADAILATPMERYEGKQFHRLESPVPVTPSPLPPETGRLRNPEENAGKPRESAGDSEESVRTLYVIPARGGSKGIPGKNIKEFMGEPLIVRAIRQARDCGASDEDICLTTDSEEIRGVAQKAGLPVPFLRPAELAADGSGTYEVLLHALDYYRSRGREYDRLILLQPTSPLRMTADIKGAASLWRPDLDMVVSVCQAQTNPYYNAFETDSEGWLTISKGPGNYIRRQDAPSVYEYNGAVYVISVPSLLASPLSAFRRRLPYEMPRERSVDLDTPLDWEIAEALAAELADRDERDFSGSSSSSSK